MKRLAAVGLLWFAAAAAQAQTPPGPPAAPSAPAASARSCSLMSKSGDQYVDTPLPGFDPAQKSVPLAPPPAEANAAMVVCTRTTVVPELTDYRVVSEMHLPLAIKAGDKTLFLGASNGKLQAAAPEGDITPQETDAVRARLDEMNLAMQGKPPGK